MMEAPFQVNGYALPLENSGLGIEFDEVAAKQYGFRLAAYSIKPRRE